MKPERAAYIAYRLERSREALRAAGILLDAGALHSAVNRLYYACFYTVSALVLTEGKGSSKHTGVRALFNRDWVRTGRVSDELGRFYNSLLDRREDADYEDLASFEAGQVRAWLEQATAFVAEITKLTEQLLATDAPAS